MKDAQDSHQSVGEGVVAVPGSHWVESFCHWMVQHRGVQPQTLLKYPRVINGLLDKLGQDPAQYTVPGLREFVTDRVRPYSRAYAQEIATVTRMFVRYLVAVGVCPAGLEAGIPRIAHWRRATLPKYLATAEVQRIIDSCDVDTSAGVRDRAVLLLLARLGLRAGEVAGLCFSDIAWEQATLRVSGKSRREDLLPLTQEVGDAILAYLDSGRPALDDDHVFLCVVGLPAPLIRQTISSIVDRAIRRAGVQTNSHGAHLLRHSLATEMLREGRSLPEIASVLRHQSIETTTIYAKVDVRLLQLVAQPWPEVAPC